MKVRCFKHCGKLTKLEKLCLSSFVHHHSAIELFSYEPIANVPTGVIQKNAEEILPKESDAFRFNSIAGIQSLFRWKTLHDLGGCFIGTDILCVRPFEFDEAVVFGKKCDIDFYRWGIDILIFPPRHDACAYMLERCLHPHFPIKGDKFLHQCKKIFRKRFTRSLNPVKPWKIGGESGFQSAVEKFNLACYAQKPPVFYPVHEARWQSPFDSTFATDLELLPMTRAVALNSDAAKRAGFDLNQPLPSDSLVSHYASKYSAVA